jgi:hypothetical protein
MSLILKLLNLVVSTQYVLSKKDHEDLIFDHAFILKAALHQGNNWQHVALV